LRVAVLIQASRLKRCGPAVWVLALMRPVEPSKLAAVSLPVMAPVTPLVMPPV
jgi:hypothetical protein